MEKVLESVNPESEQAAFLWTAKELDELLFLGDKEAAIKSYFPISLSPYLPISLSPYLPISLSPYLPTSYYSKFPSPPLTLTLLPFSYYGRELNLRLKYQSFIVRSQYLKCKSAPYLSRPYYYLRVLHRASWLQLGWLQLSLLPVNQLLLSLSH